MEIAPVTVSTETGAAASASAVPEKSAENREAIQAVKAINAAGVLGQDNELTFQFDRATQRLVIQVVNRATNEVMSQIPPEYVLRLAEQLREAQSK
jgi:flagellar protein FlaG